MMCFLWFHPFTVLQRFFSRRCHGVTRGGDETLVFFDLETTGLATSTCDIVQMSAISGERTFNVYIYPRCNIDYGASRVTGLTTSSKNLLLHGQPVPTVPLNTALNLFISFLKSFSRPVLVGHNCKLFDCPILLRILKEFYLLEEFKEVVSGYLDTLLLCKEMFRLQRYSQPFLVKHFLQTSYGAHNATEDARILQELYNFWSPSTDLLFTLLQSAKFFFQGKTQCALTFLPNMNQGVTRGGDETLVFFDLETTGFGTSTCDIVQMSAISGERMFNVYIFPRCPIEDSASRVTGLTTSSENLLLHGQPVQTVPLNTALNLFISFLKSFSRPVLVGHNCKLFDCPILLRILIEFYLLEEFKEVVSGYLDTLLLCKEMFSLPKYSQTFLVENFLQKSYGAHNAIEDVRALQKLYNFWSPSTDLVNKHKFIL